MHEIERAYTQHAQEVYRYLLSLSHNEELAEELENPDMRKPCMTEVYYLPLRNLPEKLDSLSDEEFDAMREQGALIWSGMSV